MNAKPQQNINEQKNKNKDEIELFERLKPSELRKMKVKPLNYLIKSIGLGIPIGNTKNSVLKPTKQDIILKIAIVSNFGIYNLKEFLRILRNAQDENKTEQNNKELDTFKNDIHYKPLACFWKDKKIYDRKRLNNEIDTENMKLLDEIIHLKGKMNDIRKMHYLWKKKNNFNKQNKQRKNNEPENISSGNNNDENISNNNNNNNNNRISGINNNIMISGVNTTDGKTNENTSTNSTDGKLIDNVNDELMDIISGLQSNTSNDNNKTTTQTENNNKNNNNNKTSSQIKSPKPTTKSPKKSPRKFQNDGYFKERIRTNERQDGLILSNRKKSREDYFKKRRIILKNNSNNNDENEELNKKNKEKIKNFNDRLNKLNGDNNKTNENNNNIGKYNNLNEIISSIGSKDNDENKNENQNKEEEDVEISLVYQGIEYKDPELIKQINEMDKLNKLILTSIKNIKSAFLTKNELIIVNTKINNNKTNNEKFVKVVRGYKMNKDDFDEVCCIFSNIIKKEDQDLKSYNMIWVLSEYNNCNLEIVKLLNEVIELNNELKRIIDENLNKKEEEKRKNKEKTNNEINNNNGKSNKFNEIMKEIGQINENERKTEQKERESDKIKDSNNKDSNDSDNKDEQEKIKIVNPINSALKSINNNRIRRGSLVRDLGKNIGGMSIEKMNEVKMKNAKDKKNKTIKLNITRDTNNNEKFNFIKWNEKINDYDELIELNNKKESEELITKLIKNNYTIKPRQTTKNRLINSIRNLDLNENENEKQGINIKSMQIKNTGQIMVENEMVDVIIEIMRKAFEILKSKDELHDENNNKDNEQDEKENKNNNLDDYVNIHNISIKIINDIQIGKVDFITGKINKKFENIINEKIKNKLLAVSSWIFRGWIDKNMREEIREKKERDERIRIRINKEIEDDYKWVDKIIIRELNDKIKRNEKINDDMSKTWGSMIKEKMDENEKLVEEMGNKRKDLDKMCDEERDYREYRDYEYDYYDKKDQERERNRGNQYIERNKKYYNHNNDLRNNNNGQRSDGWARERYKRDYNNNNHNNNENGKWNRRKRYYNQNNHNNYGNYNYNYNHNNRKRNYYNNSGGRRNQNYYYERENDEDLNEENNY